MPQFIVKAIKKSGDENWLQMIATDTNTEIKVFDNSPLIGRDDFSFMQAGKSYDCQNGLLCDVLEVNSANQTMMSVVGKAKVGATAWWVVADDHNMQWLIPAKQKLPEKREVYG